MKSSIPENLVIPLLEQWENGKTDQECANWLKETHNLDVSRLAVCRRIKIIRDIRMQATKDAIAQNASDQALDYVSMMAQDIIKLNKKTTKLLESEDDDKLLLAKTLIDIKHKLIITQMNLLGMDKPEKEQQDQELIIDNMLNKLPKLN